MQVFFIVYNLLSQKPHKRDIIVVYHLITGEVNLRAVSRAIDRFCQKHRNFGIPRLMRYIVLISAVILILGGIGEIFIWFMFHAGLILRLEVWRLISWIFLQFPPPYYVSLSLQSVFFAAIALYFYHFLGSSLEREWGTAKFSFFYFSGVILHIIFGFVVYFISNVSVLILPTYLNLSMLFAFATLFPDVQIRLFLVLPIKIKWLGLFNAAYFIYIIVTAIIAGDVISALLPVVAILNYLLMCGDDLLSYLRPLKVRTSPQVVNFKKAARQVKRDLEDKPYRHKCAVCGKTDTEYPDLEFRYCSRCNGYHCFCIEHINNHIHFE